MSATRRPVPARALSGLERWLGEWAAAEGVTAGRLRRFVAVAVVAAMVQRARDDQGRPLFLLKGGSDLELRLGLGARATRDLDAAFRGRCATPPPPWRRPPVRSGRGSAPGSASPSGSRCPAWSHRRCASTSSSPTGASPSPPCPSSL